MITTLLTVHHSSRLLCAACVVPLLHTLLHCACFVPCPQDCKDECQDVSFPTLELKCEDVTTQQESCTVVPKQTCTEQCMCVPMKKVSISLDKKN
jgi:hypothetical protein